MAFYKSKDKTVMSAVADVKAQQEAMVAQAHAFGAAFGGKAVFVSRLDGTRIHGLKFKPPQSLDAWTSPDKFGCQRPRGKLTNVLASDTAKHEEHKALVANWAAAKRHASVSFDPVYEAVGTTWGETLFSGLGFFEHSKTLYIDTELKLNDKVTEILGSEYAAAEKASKRKDKAEG